MTYTDSPKTHGCVVCDVEDETIAHALEDGEKAPRRFYSEDARDEMMASIISGEAYQSHKDSHEERLAALDIGSTTRQARHRTGRPRPAYDAE